MIEEKYKKQIISIIEKYLPNCKIYLFGSRAIGDFYEGSDVDISIDNGEKVSYEISFKIRSELEESTIPFFVDIIDINNIGDEMKNQILKHRIVWKN